MEKIQNQCEMRKTMNVLNARWDELVEEFDGKIGIHNEAVLAPGGNGQKVPGETGQYAPDETGQ